MRLPESMDPDDFDERYRLEPNLWREAIAEVCEAHGIAAEEITAFADGSNLVAAVGDEIIAKVFPPFHRHQWDSERQVLPVFWEQTPLQVPRCIAVGERPDSWTYILMTRVSGESLEERWPALVHSSRVGVMRRIGETIASAHRISVGDLASLEPLFSSFLERQIASCRKRHQRLGAPDWILSAVDEYLRPGLDALNLAAPHVVLTGEYTPFNLLIDPHSDALVAMVDFADAMIGPPAYDLLGPALFLCGGEPKLLQALFEPSSIVSWPPTLAQQHGLMALALLHRYSNLNAQIRIEGWREAGSLEALASWAFAGVRP